MLKIRFAEKNEFEIVRDFYYRQIDEMQDAEYKSAWTKGVYPSDDFMRESVENGELVLGFLDDQIVAAMVVNHLANEGYNGVSWGIDAKPEEVTVIHALGVLNSQTRKGFAGEMVRFAIDYAKKNNQKAMRLDVLDGNLPAGKTYVREGYKYISSVDMFYEDTGWTKFHLYEKIL